MSNHEFEDDGAAAASSSDDDLSKFLLGRLALQTRELEIDKLFRALVKLEGSDLHMRVGSPPMVRTKGELRAFNRGPVDAEEMVRLLTPMLDERGCFEIRHVVCACDCGTPDCETRQKTQHQSLHAASPA
jgi:hypothetical protein